MIALYILAILMPFGMLYAAYIASEYHIKGAAKLWKDTN